VGGRIAGGRARGKGGLSGKKRLRRVLLVRERYRVGFRLLRRSRGNTGRERCEYYEPGAKERRYFVQVCDGAGETFASCGRLKDREAGRAGKKKGDWVPSRSMGNDRALNYYE